MTTGSHLFSFFCKLNCSFFSRSTKTSGLSFHAYRGGGNLTWDKKIYKFYKIKKQTHTHTQRPKWCSVVITFLWVSPVNSLYNHRIFPNLINFSKLILSYMCIACNVGLNTDLSEGVGITLFRSVTIVYRINNNLHNNPSFRLNVRNILQTIVILM